MMIGCWLSMPAAAGSSTSDLSDFTCLQAIIPATDSYWIKTHRTDYALPQLSPDATAIAISHWKKDRLVEVFVYTEKSFRRFDRARIFGVDGESERTLSSLDKTWWLGHTLAVKSEALEVFRISLEPVSGWDHSHKSRGAMAAFAALASVGAEGGGAGAGSSVTDTKSADAPREPVSSVELGGWLVEAEKAGDVNGPIHREIELRKKWAQENNLDSDRFKAWLRADKVCSGEGAAGAGEKAAAPIKK
jgi:hypothetical protein